MSGFKGLLGWTHSLREQYSKQDIELLLRALATSNTTFGIPLAFSETGSEATMISKFHSDMFYLDVASLLPVSALSPFQEMDSILDMCAAPGGKSLAMLFLNQGLQFRLTSTDEDWGSDRMKRLRHNIESSEKYVADSVVVPPEDIDNICAIGFDRILVDAPCTSDRHLLSSGDIASWSAKKVRMSADRQIDLLTTALSRTKAGGRVVYSTCALSIFENDNVVDRVLSNSSCEILPFDKSCLSSKSVQESLGSFLGVVSDMVDALQRTKFGYLLCPHQVVGFNGPIYFSLIRKL